MFSELEEPETMQEVVRISTPRGTVRGVLHPADDARGAVVMVGGAGGGIHGPSGIYEKLATSLQTEGAAALRLEYRIPNYLHECVYDVLAATAALVRRGVDRAVLVGWSFGGAVVISAGAESEAVVGVATVASQTYGAGAVGELSPPRACCCCTAPPIGCFRTGVRGTCMPARASPRSWCCILATATASRTTARRCWRSCACGAWTSC